MRLSHLHTPKCKNFTTVEPLNRGHIRLVHCRKAAPISEATMELAVDFSSQLMEGVLYQRFTLHTYLAALDEPLPDLGLVPHLHTHKMYIHYMHKSHGNTSY